MLRKISNLKNCGIFHDFSWGTLDQFKKTNLLYGWNYSGKTTLSKLFQCIEFKDKYRLFPETEFSLTIEKNGSISEYTHSDLENFPYNMKVFNAQYVKDVFISEDMDLDFRPISFYLGDPSGSLVQEIRKLSLKNERLKNIRDNRYKIIISDFNNYNKSSGKFSAKAKEIRENYLNNQLDQNQLNKAVIERITVIVKHDLSEYVLPPSERDLIKTEALGLKEYERQNENYNINPNLDKIATAVKSVLEDSAPKSVAFPELENDEVLFKWVQKGKELHENAIHCKFCTEKLPQNRISNLNSYYSEKLKEIQNTIRKIEQAIFDERKHLKITFPDKILFGDRFRKDYQNGVDRFNDSLIKYEEQLNILENDLKRKTSHYFENINSTEIEIVDVKGIVEEIENIVKYHNKWLLEREQSQQKALDKLLKHYVSEYLQSENYLQKEINKNNASQIIANVDLLIQNHQSQIQKYEAELKSKVKGKKELNDALEILLHRNDLKIEIEDDKFSLQRNGDAADNFSEGEKSAIAFAYFLTELKSLQTEEPPKLPNTIVFIDDPISSLDSNHIFQVSSLIKNFFQEDDFAQLFISTHNFEFFSVMLDTNMFGNRNKDMNGNKRALYLVKRKDDNTSEIKKLPLSFSTYKSEYVALFHTLKEFNELENKEEFQNLILLPNAMRRFMELYTLMRFPSNQDLDKRISKVFNPTDKPAHNTKLLHWFSHQQQFEKIQQHDDKILQIEGAIKELLNYIEHEDELHWKGLNGS